jgi:hypothetical protein
VGSVESFEGVVVLGGVKDRVKTRDYFREDAKIASP